MSARIPPGYIETVLGFTVPGQSGDVVVGLGWETTGGFTVEDVPGFIDALSALTNGAWSEDAAITEVTFRIGQDGPDDIVIVAAGVDVPGSGSGEMLPVNNAFLINKVTAQPGRRGRGRSFWPGVTSSSVNPDGTVPSGSVTLMNDALAAFITGADGVGLSPALLHQTAPNDPTPILGMITQGKIATQRTRLRD